MAKFTSVVILLPFLILAFAATHVVAADADPLQRLLGVRQLKRLITQTDCSEHGIITEYLRLLLSREQETVIRDAVLDSLQILVKV